MIAAPGFEGTDRYQLRRLIGRGGMGVVYEAFDQRYATAVALKLLPTASADALLRFKREFRTAAAVKHSNLVRLGELIVYSERWFFTMELVRGVDFVRHVRGRAGHASRAAGAHVETQRSPELSTFPGLELESTAGGGPEAVPDEDRLRRALWQLVQGLSALHAAGCVHRDVKPSNVMVEDAGRVVVLDFGLASMAATETTLFGAGTPAYMAPEQAIPGPVEASADWYAVGVILFELLTGRLPFAGAPHQIVAAKQSDRPPKVCSLSPAAPADLAALCDALLARAPRERPTQAEIQLALLGGKGADGGTRRWAVAPPVEMLGREVESSLLDAALADVQSHGNARAIILLGESGIGKSTLGHAFFERAQSSGQVLALSARCHERELVPYKAVDGIVDALARWLSRLHADEVSALLPPRAAVLAQSFPVLARLELLRDLREPDAAIERREVRSWLFTAFRDLFRAIGARKPVLLFIDDLQYSDRDSLALLTETLRPPDAPRLLVLGTLRIHAGSEPAPLLHPDVREEHVLLRGLSPGATRALARSVIGGSDHETSLVELVARESAGHPLFIRELAQSASSQDLQAGSLTLESVLSARAAATSEPARRLLDVLAIAGTPMEVAVIGAASGVAGPELFTAVEELVEARLIQAVSGIEDGRLEPTHDRVRASALSALGAAEVRALHRCLASALEACGQRVASAAHWSAAGEDNRAAEHYRVAAELSADALAFDDAAEQYQIAMRLGTWSSEQLFALELALADALSNAGKGTLAAPHYLAAAQAAPDSLRPRLNRRAAEELIRSGRLDEGLAIARGILAGSSMTLPRFPLLALLARRLLLRLPRPREERDVSAWDPAELERIDLCWSMSSGLALTDHILGAYFQSLGLWRALRHGDPYRMARGVAAEAAFTAAHARQSTERVAGLLDRADHWARRSGDERALGTVLMMSGIADHLRGDFTRAQARLEAAASTFRERCTGTIWELDACRQFWLECLFYQGEARPLIEAVHDGLRQARLRGSLYAATNLQTGLSNVVWLLEGDPVEARERAREAMASWSSRGFHVQHWYDLVAQAHIDLYENEGAAAHERVEASWRQLQRSQLLRITHTRVVALHLRARAALAAARELSPGRRMSRIRVARAVCRALARERTRWARALGGLIHTSVQCVESGSVTRQAVLDIAVRLRGADLGMYATFCEALAHEEGARELSERGVRSPSAMARVLLPGLYLGQFD